MWIYNQFLRFQIYRIYVFHSPKKIGICSLIQTSLNQKSRRKTIGSPWKFRPFLKSSIFLKKVSGIVNDLTWIFRTNFLYELTEKWDMRRKIFKWQLSTNFLVGTFKRCSFSRSKAFVSHFLYLNSTFFFIL